MTDEEKRILNAVYRVVKNLEEGTKDSSYPYKFDVKDFENFMIDYEEQFQKYVL